MPEIGTSGSMSEDGKRSVAKWPKLPRLSSTLPKRTYRDDLLIVRFWSRADIGRVRCLLRPTRMTQSGHERAAFAAMHGARRTDFDAASLIGVPDLRHNLRCLRSSKCAITKEYTPQRCSWTDLSEVKLQQAAKMLLQPPTWLGVTVRSISNGAYAARGSEKLQKAKLGLPFCMGAKVSRTGVGANSEARECGADRDDPRIRAIVLGGDSNAPRVCRAQRE